MRSPPIRCCYKDGVLTREGLWRRIGSPDAWALPWALATACALPWLLPETWGGIIPAWIQVLAWGLVIASAPLLRTRWAALPLSLALVWGGAGHLARRAMWERALPVGVARLEGRILDPWIARGHRREGRITLTKPSALAGLDLPVTLPVEGTPAPAIGTPVRFQGELRPVDPAPVFLPERPLWRARSDAAPRRIHLASALEFEAIGPARPSVASAWRAWVHGRFEALPLALGAGRDLWGALALGRPVVHEESLTPFAESGTLHLLVVSGLQVTLVLAGAEWLLRRMLRRRPRLASTAAALVGLAYAMAVGFSAPVWRGFLMGLAWVLGRSEGWRLPPVLTLHGALLLWFLVHPAAGCEPGFLLAWWALLGLIWGAEPLAGFLEPFLGSFAAPLARLAAPWLSTLPLVAIFFGGVPAWGIAANLVVLPLVTLLTPLCLLLMLMPLPGLTPALARGLERTGDTILPLFAGIRPLCTANLLPWLGLALAWPALAHAHAILRRTRFPLLLTLGATLLLLLARGTGRPAETLELEAVDIGQGDALLLRIPGGDATLVDAGPSPWAARRIAKVLSRRGVKEPLHAVLTHPHADHAGGWATLARLWPLASTTLPGLARVDSAWAPFIPAGSHTIEARRDDAWRQGEAAFSVRWPPGRLDLEALEDANAVSLVLRITWRDRQLWLMGDALAIQERDLLDLSDPGAFAGSRLLKLGHHGSASSSDPRWIGALRPGLSFVTAGNRNRFGHPHSETMAAFEAAHLAPPYTVGTARGLRALAFPGGWALEGGDGSRRWITLAARPGPTAGR